MLRRPLDRIELRPDDKKELEERGSSSTPSGYRTPVNQTQCVRRDAATYTSTQSTAANANASANTQCTSSVTEEVEVKLKLMSKEDHTKAKRLFGDGHVATYDQENFFFDGEDKALSSNFVIMRIRFYNKTEKAVLTVKGRQRLADGIGRATEEEEDIEVAQARKCVTDPNLILQLDSDLVRSKISIKGFVGLGGFENIRDEYLWKGYKLEIDETIYDFGTNYEIECETDRPEELRNQLEQFFAKNQIRYQYRTATKFGCFMKKSLDD